MVVGRAGGVRALFATLFLSLAGCALALDNPDAPDRLAAFQAREAPYLRVIERRASTTEAYRRAYAEYEAFLDEELNKTYQMLRSKLEEPAAARLRDAQRAWIAYRDQAFAFVDENWQRSRFGSSAVISRGDYRTRIIRARVVTLLHYLQNY